MHSVVESYKVESYNYVVALCMYSQAHAAKQLIEGHCTQNAIKSDINTHAIGLKISSKVMACPSQASICSKHAELSPMIMS